MDLSQLAVIALAFLAGLSSLFVLRIVWSLMKCAFYVSVVAGFAALVFYNSSIPLPQIDPNTSDKLKSAFTVASIGFEKVKVLASHSDVVLRLLSDRQAGEAEAKAPLPDYSSF